jgi:hypothetical protein
LKLKDTTLICVDCVDAGRAERVLNRCLSLCEFDDVKLLTHLQTDYPHRTEIENLPSLIHYSIFCLKELYKYVDTKYMLIVQRDGWILNPQAWNDEWFKYDYIGPLFNQYDTMGVGGFSFRSKAIMETVSGMYPDWNRDKTEYFQGNVGCWEDGAIAITLKPELKRRGFKFATLEDAAKFAQGGNPNNQYWIEQPFGFHGSWRAIDQTTGKVSSQIKHDGFVPLPI